MSTGDVIVYRFKESKVNKNSTIYQLEDSQTLSGWITDPVKIEKFQGFSKATNTDYYFKLRDQSNWAKCEQVTGLWKTPYKGVFYGDRRMQGTKTLILFQLSINRENLTIYVYPNGYYPSQSVIYQLAQEL